MIAILEGLNFPQFCFTIISIVLGLRQMLANESDVFFKNFKGMVFSVDLNLHIFSNYSLVRDPKHVLFNWLFFIICLDAPKLHGLLTQYQSLLVCYFDNRGLMMKMGPKPLPSTSVDLNQEPYFEKGLFQNVPGCDYCTQFSALRF